MPLTTILFDAGGVLVQPDWQRVREILGDMLKPVSNDRLRQAEWICHRELDTATVIQDTNDDQRWFRFFERTLALAGVPTPDDLKDRLLALYEVHRQNNLWSDLPSDVVPTLDRLQSSGYRLGVVSNANGTVESLLHNVGLSNYFLTIVDSGREGVEKPNPEIFRRALARMNAAPSQTTHIGDYFHIDVVGAERAQIFPVLLDRAALHIDRKCARVTSLNEFAARILQRNF